MTWSSKVLSGFLILLGFLAGGELTARASGAPIPGSVLAMAFLGVALWARWIRLESVEAAADALLEHLGLLFVPAGVGVMLHFDLISREAFALVVTVILSTAVVLGTTGYIAHLLASKDKQSHG